MSRHIQTYVVVNTDMNQLRENQILRYRQEDILGIFSLIWSNTVQMFQQEG